MMSAAALELEPRFATQEYRANSLKEGLLVQVRILLSLQHKADYKATVKDEGE
jgi:hypothetical protein